MRWYLASILCWFSAMAFAQTDLPQANALSNKALEQVVVEVAPELNSETNSEPNSETSSESNVAGSLVPGSLAPVVPTAPVAPAASVESYSSGASIAKVLLGLLLVIAVFLASAWLLKRLQNGINPQHTQMKTLAAMALTNRERIVLVEVAGVQMVLGVAPGSVTALHVFDEPVVDASHAPAEQFAAKLAQFMGPKHDQT